LLGSACMAAQTMDLADWRCCIAHYCKRMRCEQVEP
jgi:hypothetical protein